MKTLLSTTAVMLALGFPTFTLAQEAAPAADAQTGQANMQSAGFMTARGQSDLFASELMGHDVYARRVAADMNAEGARATMDADGTRHMTDMDRAELDGMDNIGQITEIVLSSDGQIRALVIGVGGFLGMGEQDVAVTMDQVTFAADPQDAAQMYIVVNTGADMLQGSPAFDRTAARGDGAAMGQTGMQTDGTQTADNRTDGNAMGRNAFAAPDMQRDGYTRVAVTEVSTEMLMGESVYGINDNSVGSVTDMIIDDEGAITNVIIDFGGFLGIGSSQASIGFDELTILSNEGYADVRLYVSATKDEIRALPQYTATN